MAIAAVTNFRFTGGTTTTLTLAWARGQVYDGIKVYGKVYGAASYTLFDTLDGSANGYTATGLASGKRHYFYIIAYDGAEVTSPATINASTVLAPPTGLNITATSATQINLAWSNALAYYSSIVIERQIAGGSWTTIYTAAGNATSYNNSGLTTGTKYYYRIKATLGSPHDTTSAYTSTVNSTTTLMPPTGLVLSVINSTTIDLNWTNGSTGYTSVLIYRSTDGTNFTLAHTVSGSTVYKRDSGLTAGQTYYYKIRAYRNTNHNVYSAYTSVKSTSLSFPAPSGLWGTSVSGTEIAIHWSDNTNDEDGFKVERNGSVVETVGANVKTHTSTGLTPGVQYSFKVRAYKGTEYSAYSNTIYITAGAPPVAPSDLEVITVSASQLNVLWTDNSTDETSFVVEQSADGVSDWTETDTVDPNVTSLEVTGLGSDELLYFRVKAVNASGSSSYCAVASGRTMAAIATPTGLVLNPYSDTEMELFFQDNSTDEDDHRVEWKAYSEEALTDGGFETWASATNATYWTESVSGTSTVNRDGTEKYAGTYAVRLDIDASNSVASTLQSVTLTASGIYRLTFYYKNSAAGKTGRLHIRDSGYNVYVKDDGTWATSANYIVLPNATDWTLYTLYFTAHASYTSYVVVLANSSAASSSIYFDSASLLRYAFTELVTLPANVTYYKKTGLTAGTAYSFRVRAKQGASYSGYSNEATATTLELPNAPSALDAEGTISTGGSGFTEFTGWSHRKKITIKPDHVDANLTGFPLKVPISADADIGAACLANGHDIRITASDGETELPYDRRYFTVASGEASGLFFVKTDPSTSGTDLYIYYGNSGASDGNNPTAVWDANFKGVYHLDEAYGTGADNYKDSTAAAHHGTLTDADADSAQADGPVYKAVDLNGDADYLSVADHVDHDPGGAMTIEAWVNLSNFEVWRTVVGHKTSGDPPNWAIMTGSDGVLYSFRFVTASGGNQINSGSGLSGQLVYVVGTFDKSLGSDRAKLFTNGALANAINAYAEDIVSGGEGLDIGRWSLVPRYIDGLIAEVRYSIVARSAAWIKFTYYNITEADGCLTWGEDQEFSEGPAESYILSTWDTKARLSWTAPTYGATKPVVGYKVEKSVDDGANYTLVQKIYTGVCDYLVQGLTASTAYKFRVCAFNAVGDSAYCTALAVTTAAQYEETALEKALRRTSIKPVILYEINPKMTMTGFALADGYTYMYDVATEEKRIIITSVYEDGEALTLAASSSACESTPGSWIFNNATRILHVHPSGSDDPADHLIEAGFWLRFQNYADSTIGNVWNGEQYLLTLSTGNIGSLQSGISQHYEGSFQVTGSTITLINNRMGDGSYYWDTRYARYTFRGQRARIRLGVPGFTYSQFEEINAGIIDKMEIADDKITFSHVDPRAGMHRTLPINHYWSSEWPSMTDTQNGASQPMLFGTKANCPTVCLDSTSWRYGYHDGRCGGVSKLYVDGVEKTEGTDWYDDPWHGVVTIDEDVALTGSEVITVDFNGIEQDDHTQITNHISALRYLLLIYLDQSEADDINRDLFFAAELACAQTCSIYLHAEEGSESIIRNIEQSVLAFTITDLGGKLGVRPIATSADSSARYVQKHMTTGYKQSKARESLFYRIVVKYAEDPTAGTFSSQEKIIQGNRWKYGMLKTYEATTYLTTASAALTLAGSIAAILDKDLVTFTGPLYLIKVIPGDVLKLTRDRYFGQTGTADNQDIRALDINRNLGSPLGVTITGEAV